MIPLGIYLIIGCAFAIQNRYELAADRALTDEPAVVTVLKWTLTWPWWVFRK